MMAVSLPIAELRDLAVSLDGPAGPLDELRQRLGMAVVFVTHDLTLVPLLCSRVLVMAGGRIVDECAVDEIAGSTVEETRSLVAALPGAEGEASPSAASRPRPAADRAFAATTDRANPS